MRVVPGSSLTTFLQSLSFFCEPLFSTFPALPGPDTGTKNLSMLQHGRKKAR